MTPAWAPRSGPLWTAPALSLPSRRDRLDALHRFADTSHFDLVLLDVVLRDGDGLSLLETMKRVSPETPVVMISGLHDIGVAISAMKIGAYDYLLKPIGQGQLLSTVQPRPQRT